MNIVVVDDETVWRKFAKESAALAGGFEVAGEAADGAGAVGLILGIWPAIALLDLQLPTLSAFDVIESIRRIVPPGGRQLRCLILSTHINPYTVWRSRRMGVGGLVDKRSCDAAELKVALSAVAGGQVYFSQTAVQFTRQLHGQADPFHSRMTDRELEILPYVADGCSDQEIGEGLSLSDEAVRKHVYNLFAKFSVHTRPALAREGKGLGFSRYLASADAKALAAPALPPVRLPAV